MDSLSSPETKANQPASPPLCRGAAIEHTKEGREGDCFFTNSWRVPDTLSGAAGAECWYQWSSNIAAMAAGECLPADSGGLSQLYRAVLWRGRWWERLCGVTRRPRPCVDVIHLHLSSDERRTPPGKQLSAFQNLYQVGLRLEFGASILLISLAVPSHVKTHQSPVPPSEHSRTAGLERQICLPPGPFCGAAEKNCRFRRCGFCKAEHDRFACCGTAWWLCGLPIGYRAGREG